MAYWMLGWFGMYRLPPPEVTGMRSSGFLKNWHATTSSCGVDEVDIRGMDPEPHWYCYCGQNAKHVMDMILKLGWSFTFKCPIIIHKHPYSSILIHNHPHSSIFTLLVIISISSILGFKPLGHWALFVHCTACESRWVLGRRIGGILSGNQVTRCSILCYRFGFYLPKLSIIMYHYVWSIHINSVQWSRAHTYIYIIIYAYNHTYKCAHMHIHTYTHTHTHTNR